MLVEIKNYFTFKQKLVKSIKMRPIASIISLERKIKAAQDLLDIESQIIHCCWQDCNHDTIRQLHHILRASLEKTVSHVLVKEESVWPVSKVITS